MLPIECPDLSATVLFGHRPPFPEGGNGLAFGAGGECFLSQGENSEGRNIEPLEDPSRSPIDPGNPSPKLAWRCAQPYEEPFCGNGPLPAP